MKKNIFLIFIVLLVGLLTGCNNNISTLETETANDISRAVLGTPYAVLYSEMNFGGSYEIITDQNTIHELSSVNNKVSSIKIYGDIRVKLYNYKTKGIYTRWLTKDISDFRDIGFNDLTSAILIEKNNPEYYAEIVLQHREGFIRPMWVYPGKKYDLDIFAGELTGISLYNDDILTLYAADGSFTQVFRGNTNLRDISFYRKAVSMSLDKPKTKYAVLYDSKDYGGSGYSINSGYVVVSKSNTVLSSLNFDNKLSSVQVFNLGGSPVKFYHSIYRSSSSSVHSRFPRYRPIGNYIAGNATFGYYGYDNKVSLVDF